MKKKVNLLLLGVASISMVLASCGNPGGGGKVAPSLTGIQIKQGPTKTTYLVNEEIDLAGLVVEALYSDDTKTEVSNYTTNKADVDMSFAGTKAVTVTFEEKTASFTVTVRNSAKTDWTEAEKSTMAASKYLYGEILPFVDVDGVTVYGDVTVSSEKQFFMQGGTTKKDDVKNYAAKFRGWEGGDMSSKYGVEAGSIYEFEKAVQYNIGTETEPVMAKRYVHVQFYGLSGSKPAKEGKFTLSAKALYTYTWAEAAQAFAKAQADDVFSTNYVPAPSDTFDRIQVMSSYYAIVAEFAAEGDDAGYKQKLTGWNIHEEKDEDGYYVAESPDGLYSISFLYREGTFLLFFGPAFSWPAAAIASYQALDGNVAFDVPAYEGQEANYYGYPTSDDSSYQIEISGSSQEEFEAYAEKFTGWDVGKIEVGEGDAKALVAFEAEKFVEDKGYVYVTGNVEVNNDKLFVIINVVGAATTYETAWPAEDVAKDLGEEVTEVVPAPTGTFIGFKFVEGGINWETFTIDPSYVLVKCEGDAEEALEAYKTQLTGLGYELINGSYYSPNKQISLTVEEGMHNTFSIVFEENSYENISSTFPQAIANSFAAAFGGTNPVPAFPGADFYYTSTNNKAIFCAFDYEEDPEHPEDTPEAAYSAILEEALWTEIEPDSYGYYRYVSPDGKVRLAFLYDVDYGEFGIYVENALPPVWPAEDIAANLQAAAGSEYVFKDSVPSIDISTGENLASVGAHYSDADVMITYATAEEAAEVLANYEAALIQAEYELDAFTGSTYRGVSKQYISKNGEIRAEVFVSGRTVYLLFYFRADVSSTSFPLSALETEFAKVVPTGVVLQDSLLGGPVRDLNDVYKDPAVSSGTVQYEIDFDTMTALMEYVTATTVGYTFVAAESTETRLVFLSEHNEIKITYIIDDSYVSSGYGVALQAIVTYNEEPNAKLARLFAESVPSSYTMQDEIPEMNFAAAKTYNIALYKGSPYVGMSFNSEEERTAFLTAYAASLQEANFTPDNSAEMETYISEHTEIKVEFELNGTTGVFVNFYFVGDAEPDPDPAFAELKTTIETKLGETPLVDSVPAIPAMSSFSIEVFDNTDGLGVSASFADMTDLTAFEDAYKAALVEAGYTADGEGNYTTTNGQLTFSFEEQDLGSWGCYLTIFVEINEAEPASENAVFATLRAQIVTSLGSETLTDTIPGIEFTSSIATSIDDAEFLEDENLLGELFLVFETEEQANAFVAAYEAALLANGYTKNVYSYYGSQLGVTISAPAYEEMFGGWFVNVDFQKAL